MVKIIDTNGNERECVKVAPDKSYPGFIKADFESKIRKGFKHSEWYPQEEFLKRNPDFKLEKEKISSIKEDLGVVSVAGDDFLQDITKNWKENEFAGTPIWISRGKGESQQRVVVKNDKNKLYIDKNWDTRPDNTSQYVLSFNVQNNIPARGNTLPGVETRDLINKMIKKAKKSS